MCMTYCEAGFLQRCPAPERRPEGRHRQVQLAVGRCLGCGRAMDAKRCRLEGEAVEVARVLLLTDLEREEWLLEDLLGGMNQRVLETVPYGRGWMWQLKHIGSMAWAMPKVSLLQCHSGL